MLPVRTLGFLCLVFAAGAESTCPSDVDLTVTPAEVLAPLGHSLSLSCSSTVEDHKEIYWKIGDEEFYEEEDENSVSHNLTLSDYDMTAQCRIKINKTHDCSKDVNVTVFKNPEVVSSVRRVDATGEETRYDLQCDVVDVAPVRNLVVEWYKNNETVLTKLFDRPTKAPVNESVTLAVNISRSERAAQLRCEARLDFGKAAMPHPVVSQVRSLSALYAPEMKRTNHDGYVETPAGGNVTLNCDAEGNPPPVFSWTCDGADMMESANNLTFAADSDATCICVATNRLGSRRRHYQIYVTREFSMSSPFMTTPGPPTPRACPLTLTPPEIVARFGDPVLADCNTSATNLFGMGWESPVRGTGSEPRPHIAWSVEKLEDWSITPFCYLTLKDGYQCQKSLHVTLYKTPDRMSISGPDYGLEGDKLELTCHVDGVAPANKLTVSWFRDEEEHRPTNFPDTSRTPVNLSSTLTVTAKRDYNGSVFRCEAVLHLGPNGPESITTASGNYTAVVHYKPLFKPCPGRHNVLEHRFSLDELRCHFDGNPPPSVRWYHEGEAVDSSRPLARNNTGMYTMQIANQLGSSNTSVGVTVEYAPSIDCGERYEVEMTPHIQTPCQAQGLPSPTLTWFKDGRKMLRWTKYDSGEYKLEATNKHGTSRHTLHLDILYAPEIKEPNRTMEVDQGQNVTLDCRAEGNPPPEVFWFFNSSVTPVQNAGWRQSTVTVEAATSTTSGVYSCIATNRVGKVTGTVSLVIKGKSRGPSNALIWVIPILLVLVFLVLVLIIKRQKKHGQYSFIPVTAASEMRMSTVSPGGSSWGI